MNKIQNVKRKEQEIQDMMEQYKCNDYDRVHRLWRAMSNFYQDHTSSPCENCDNSNCNRQNAIAYCKEQK